MINFLVSLSDYIIPTIIIYIVAYAFLSGTNSYYDFNKGAKDGLKTVIEILPTLIGLMVAVCVIRSSGFLDFISNIIGRVTDSFGLPASTLPLIIIKMFSSSAATALLIDIYKEFGADSLAGLISSLVLSSTETIFYTMSVYFSAANIKKARWTLAGALISTLAGTIASVIIGNIIFKIL